jgi:hypothetical protein
MRLEVEHDTWKCMNSKGDQISNNSGHGRCEIKHLRFHLTPVRMGIIRKTTSASEVAGRIVN